MVLCIKSKIKCDTCKVNLRASQKRNLPDVQVNTGKSKKSRVHEKEIVFNVQAADIEQIIPHYSQRAHTQALDPLSVNPYSYDSVKLVLQKIGLTAGISRYKNETNTNDRQWVFVMCDGLPYCLAHKLIHYAYYCLNCQDSVLGMERFKENNKSGPSCSKHR